MTPTILVAYRKGDCTVCTSAGNQADPVAFQGVNAAIWDGREPAEAHRIPRYRERGAEVMAAHGVTVDPRTITRHARHVERSHRLASASSPPVGHEETIYDLSFRSVTDAHTMLGMKAVTQLSGQLEDLEPRELIAIMRGGLSAAMARSVADRIEKRPETHQEALIAIGTGHLTSADLPAYRESSSGPTAAELRAVMDLERERIIALRDEA